MNNESGELPWFTEEELQAAAAIEDVVLAAGYEVPVQLPVRQKLARDHGIEAKRTYYKASVIDKYRNNPYCHIGYDQDNQCNFIRFLNTDSSKPPDSMIRFRFDKLQNQDILIMDVADTINIPPRQIKHWLGHQVK